jgi:dihydroorotate dehydrogenase
MIKRVSVLGVAFGNDPDMSYRVVEICRQNTTKPIITKLSPNQTNIANSAQRCIDAGTDGLAEIVVCEILTNTIVDFIAHQRIVK